MYTCNSSLLVIIYVSRIKPLPGPPSRKELSYGSTRLEAWSMKSQEGSTSAR